MPEEYQDEKKQYYCSECGSEVSDSDLVCPNCGADLSKIEEESPAAEINGIAAENPDEAVVLETFVSQKDADYVIEQLAAHQINATKPLAAWSDSIKTIDVLVRRGDLSRAKEILALIRRKPKTMFLADIFSNTFTAAGKSFKRNITAASLFIPAGIIFIICLKMFFSGLYVPYFDKSKAYVYIENAKKRDITQIFYASGRIDINKKVFMELAENEINEVSLQDTVWITLSEDESINYRGYIYEINSRHAKDSTSQIFAMIEIMDPDRHITTGRYVDIEIEQEVHRNVVSVTPDCIYAEQDSSGETPRTKEFIYVVRNGKASAVEIVTGISDDNYTEILSGLSEGDEVVNDYSSYGMELKDGVAIIKGFPDTNVDLKNIVVNVVLLLLAIFVFVLIYLAVTIGVTKSASAVMEEEEITVGKVFRTIFSVSFFRALMIQIITFAAAFGPFVLFIFAVPFAKKAGSDFLGIILVILFFPAVIFSAYIYIKWYFAFMHTVITGDGIIASLRKSFFLTKGMWWRTFGIILLVSLVVNFIVSLVSTPITFIFMWDFISASMQNAVAGKEDPEMTLKLVQSMGWGFGFSMIFNYILQSLIAPVFAVVMYYDARIRKNDFFLKLKEQTNNNPEPLTGQPQY